MFTSAPSQQVCLVRPLGWETDPEEERYKLSTLDYFAPCTYTNYALYFELDDATDKRKVAEGLRHGLARTLSQTRHLCSTIEKDSDGDHSFVHRTDSSVELHFQWLDAPEDAAKYPSFQQIKDSHFNARALGDDIDLWRIPHMRHGHDNPNAHPDKLTAVMAIKASFVRGGLVLIMPLHHYASDQSGWASFIHQYADNCRAFLTGTAYPPWNPACLDVSDPVLTKPPLPDDQKIDIPGPMFFDPANPLPLPGGRQTLLFHLPKSKAAQLKALVSQSAPPSNNNSNYQPGQFISTYDAAVAFIWRALTRLRYPHYAAQLPGGGGNAASHTPFFAEAIDLRRRLTSVVPPFPPRMQRNVVTGIVSLAPPADVPAAPSVADLAFPLASSSESAGEKREREGEEAKGWPLHRLASYVRALTERGSAPAALEAHLGMLRAVRDKTRCGVDLQRLAALSVGVSDHRGAGRVLGTRTTAAAATAAAAAENGTGDDEGPADFGFGKIVAYRQLWGKADVGMVIVYPPRAGMGEDEGFEFTVAYEKVLAKELLEDEEWGRWFEYRGLDWEEE